MENSFSCLILRATCGTRTRDPRITNALLYQLSQGGIIFYLLQRYENNTLYACFFQLFFGEMLRIIGGSLFF